MKVLILGDPCSVWEKEFVEYVLLPLGTEVYLQENYGSEERYAEFYSQSGVTVIPYSAPPAWIQRIPKVRVVAAKFLNVKEVRQYQPFDIIINMFVSPTSLLSAVFYKSNHTCVYPYFCGSDIIRATPLTCKRLKKMLKKTDGVMLASEAVNRAYTEKIGQQSALTTQVIRLGISAFEPIDAVLAAKGKNGCKSEIGVDSQKKVVCVGYNANEYQHHMQILDQIKQLPEAILNQITLFLPMTYGGTAEYINGVENSISQLKCDYKLFRTYMDKPQMALIWGATDIFINAQSTDGLSGSVLEALYAGATLLNATWLQYEEYDRWGLSYETFSDFEQLPDLLSKTVLHDNVKKNDNHTILGRYMSWSQSSASWQKFIFNGAPFGGLYG